MMTEFEYSSMTLEELEFYLPITVQRSEKRERLCSDCKQSFAEVTVNYEQRLFRSDDYGIHGLSNQRKKRWYEISYIKAFSDIPLFRTERYYNFKDALIEAHKRLDEMGLKSREDYKNASEG